MSHVPASPRSADQTLAAVSQAEQLGQRTRSLDWEISRRIIARMWRYPWLLITMLAMATGVALVNGALPHLAGLVIAGPIENPAEFEANWAISARQGLYLGTAGVVFLGLAWVVLMRARFRLVALMAERVAHDLRAAMFSHLQTLGMDFFDRTKVGWIIARGGGDIDQVRSAVSQVLPRVLIALVQMCYAVVAIGLFDGVLLLILLGIAPFVYLLNQYFRQRLSAAHRNVRASFSRITANLAEAVSGIRITQAFAREGRNAEMFHDLCMDHRRLHLKAARAHGVYVPTLDLAGQLFIVLALLVGGWRVSEGAMTIGALIGVMLMTRVFFQPITVLGEMYNLTLMAMAGGERVFNLLDTKPAFNEPTTPHPLPRRETGMRVEFRAVSFAYEPGRPVLEGVSLRAEPGQTVALVGHTGSGKTTMAALIAKFYEPTSGDILVDDLPLREVHARDLHSQMAMVQQQNFLFQGSVLENIRFGRPDASDEDVRRVCDELGCLEMIDELPQGFETDAGERGSALSLGQRQLICFARAMLAAPRILLLDEATSAVDTLSEVRIQRALARLIEGRTSFIIAHRLSTVREADLVIVLDRGRIVERGTHDQLMAAKGVYAKSYEQFIQLSLGE